MLYPGDYVEVDCSGLLLGSGEVAVEPRMDSPAQGKWPEPSILQVVDDTLRLQNNLNLPIRLGKKPACS